MNSILITGVSSGIGEALAQHYLQNGFTVFGLSRRQPKSLIEHPQFHFVAADLTQHEHIPTALERLLHSTSELKYVILNAGQLGRIADLHETTIEELDQLMNVNVWANKTVLDSLKSLNVVVSQVVTISSGAAVNGHRGWGGYAISKAALNMLTRLYAMEWPETHFAAVAPGLVETAMQHYLCGLEPDSRYPSLARLRDSRGTPAMPQSHELAPRLAGLIQTLPQRIPSGQYIDLRVDG